jgi:hypothetical protein
MMKKFFMIIFILVYSYSQKEYFDNKIYNFLAIEAKDNFKRIGALDLLFAVDELFLLLESDKKIQESLMNKKWSNNLETVYFLRKVKIKVEGKEQIKKYFPFHLDKEYNQHFESYSNNIINIMYEYDENPNPDNGEILPYLIYDILVIDANRFVEKIEKDSSLLKVYYEITKIYEGDFFDAEFIPINEEMMNRKRLHFLKKHEDTKNENLKKALEFVRKSLTYKAKSCD